MPIKSHWHALTKASSIMEPMLLHLRDLGFTTVFVPSLSITDAIDHKRIRFNSEHLPKDKLSTFPIFAFSRSPVITSPETTNFRRIQVSNDGLNTGTPYPINYASATFQISWVVLFNNITDFEEFEVVYTTEKLFSDFREYKVFIPPLFRYNDVPEEERAIYVGSEWQMFSNAELNKLNEYVQFSLSGTAQVTFPAMSITDVDLPKPQIDQLILGFYSDLQYINKEEEFKFYKDDGDYVIEQTHKENLEIYREPLETSTENKDDSV